ncbi:MAG: tRNA(Ile)-lysidine synthetase [Candidatus Eisenbacteria bacterium]|nr:tRNA(Ile)-lysidine synthetase [Candidatus Eisenbacteria bacterium]
MKCTVCRGPAVIKTRHHNGKFCRPHFFEHIERQVRRVIERYEMLEPGERVLLGVSGGKDSMAAWDLLTRLGYDVRAVHIDAEFGPVSRRAVAHLRDFAAQRALPLRIYRYPELLGADFDAARRQSRKPVCSLCGTLKRYYLNQLALRLGCDVVATGHNLDDETAFLLGNVLHWQLGFLGRQGPVLPAEEGMVRKVKPLVRLTDDDTRRYVAARGIAVVSEPCPHARGATSRAYKRHLSRLEKEYPGSRSDFYFRFIEHVRAHLPDDPASAEVGVRHCRVCGYKTLREDRCYVCALRESVAAAEAAG